MRGSVSSTVLGSRSIGVRVSVHALPKHGSSLHTFPYAAILRIHSANSCNSSSTLYCYIRHMNLGGRVSQVFSISSRLLLNHGTHGFIHLLFKRVTIFLIFKSGDRTIFHNIRPLSLTSPKMKVFEHIKGSR